MKMKFALAAAFLALAPVAAVAETQEEQQACMNDAFTVCRDAIPDRDRVAACLAHNINRISSACRTVMLRYQQPQPAASVAKISPATSAKPVSTKASKGPLNIKPKLTSSQSASRS